MKKTNILHLQRSEVQILPLLHTFYKMDRLILGSDEAGRGSIIGPLVMVAAVMKESELHKLKELGVKDSKLLLKPKREKLFEEIQKITKFNIIKIQPDEIDNAVDGNNGLNLNWLEAEKTIELINYFNPDAAYIDCPSPNIEKYKNYLLAGLKNKKIELVVEHKCDVNFPICSAASILAKVTRDKEIKLIEEKYGNVGPGYTSNPITQKFLKENWEKHPEIFRKSWITWKNHHAEKQQKSLKEF